MCGMIRIAVRIDGAGRNLHIGDDGGVFHIPMADMCCLLDTLADAIDVKLALLITLQARMVLVKNGGRTTVNVAIKLL